MRRSAASCSAQCPVGTGVVSYNSQTYNVGISFLQPFWGTPGSSVSQNGQIGQGCYPCGVWQIAKDSTCQSCGAGASDRATLNSLGSTFALATTCIPDICPWPFVVVGQSLMYQMYGSMQYSLSQSRELLKFSSPPKYSNLPSGVCSLNIHLGGTVATIVVTILILVSAYAAAMYFGITVQDESDEVMTSTDRRKLVLGMLFITLPPAADFATDFLYISHTLFFNYIVLLVTCFFFLLPMFFFWRMLVRHGVHFSFYIGRPPAFAVMEKYDSIPKAFLGFVGYLPLYIINLPILLPLFLVGYVMYMCKVFPVSRVSNPWLRLYTRSSKHTSSVVIIIPLLQQSIFEEIIIESVPQLAIQITNNTLTSTWSTLGYISTAMSCFMVINGIWRLVYYRWYLEVKVGDIPTTPDLSNVIFNFRSIKQGEAPLGKAVDDRESRSTELRANSSQKQSLVRLYAQRANPNHFHLHMNSTVTKKSSHALAFRLPKVRDYSQTSSRP
jgi:hypothetical protein